MVEDRADSLLQLLAPAFLGLAEEMFVRKNSLGTSFWSKEEATAYET
jgi:hypothetical protein